MDLTAVLAVCLLAAAASDASPTYTVVAPDVVRPNTDFRVAISAHDIEADQESFYNQRAINGRRFCKNVYCILLVQSFSHGQIFARRMSS